MKLVCDICGKHFTANHSLYMHKLTHKPKLMLVDHGHHTGTKRQRDEEDDELPDAKRYHDDETDPGLVVIDSYDRKPRRKKPKRKFVLPKSPEPEEQGSQIVSRYTPKSDSDDQEKDSTLDYKKMYNDCMEDQLRLKQEITKQKLAHNKQIEEHMEAVQSDMKRILKENKKLQEGTEETHEDEITSLKKGHREELEDMEGHYESKIKLLTDQLKSMQDDDADMNYLAKMIFNCTTMEEIFQIKRLIEDHRIGEVVEKHLDTLQTLLLSLSYGILPICQPQRDKVSDSQRKLVNKIQTSSKATAKQTIKQNQNEVVNLFSIIGDSLKLARDSFNRFGTA